MFATIGGRIFEMGGSTDLILVSLPDDSKRFDRVSSINETDSGLGDGVSVTGSTAGAVTGVTADSFALLIGGTPDLRLVLPSVEGFLRAGEIRSVAG
ncbi:MAG: hypothetical protein JO298_08725 [Verrucomicrobia bacterium]|nr:hypothetical protein [Verrucomicrobiota bacterium]